MNMEEDIVEDKEDNMVDKDKILNSIFNRI